MKKKSGHSWHSHKPKPAESEYTKHKLKNRVLAVAVFSMLVFGTLLGLNPGGSGNVVSITASSRAIVDSYSAPANAAAGENVNVDVFVSKTSNSFAYGLVECSVKDWRGKNLDTRRLATYEPRCIKLPDSNSFTMQYSFMPLAKGYYKVQYCKLTTSPYTDCSGAKFNNLKRQTTGIYVY